MSTLRLGRYYFLWIVLFLLILLCPPVRVVAQEESSLNSNEAMGEEIRKEIPEKVDVQPVARDEEIAQRLQNILEATGRYTDPQVTVDNGVVFLRGQTRSEDYKQWATHLAQRTQDVVAVVNQITLENPPLWDFAPFTDELQILWRQTIRLIPLIGLSLIILLVTVFLASVSSRVARTILLRRMRNRLLMGVLVKLISIPILLLGIYIMLRVSGLTRLALTILGGTGIAGLVIGIAFQDIAENFLASLLISIHNPFRTGDLIEINGNLGYVQKVTTRGTVLMAFDGNFIQIPNSTVYKSIIRNYTANPSMRLDFVVGIGYDNLISDAQEIGLQVMREHPAVLQEPPPMVLVENLGTATINLRFYFWINSCDHSFIRVKSAVMRLVVRAFVKERISLPDESREVIFPRGVPIRMLEKEESESLPSPQPRHREHDGTQEAEAVTPAEVDMRNEASDVQKQLKNSRLPEQGQNLLRPSEENQK